MMMSSSNTSTTNRRKVPPPPSLMGDESVFSSSSVDSQSSSSSSLAHTVVTVGTTDETTTQHHINHKQSLRLGSNSNTNTNSSRDKTTSNNGMVMTMRCCGINNTITKLHNLSYNRRMVIYCFTAIVMITCLAIFMFMRVLNAGLSGSNSDLTIFSPWSCPRQSSNSCCEQKKDIHNFYLNYLSREQSQQQQQQQQQQQPQPQQPYTIEIKLLAYNRFNSIQRCLTSLEAAEYGNDRVDLQVFVDHFPVPEDETLINKQEFEEKMNLQYKILDMIRAFKWTHGKFSAHVRHKNGNLQMAWMEAFYPLDNHTYAFIVEDDIEVSPFYYMYLKKMINKYRYPSKDDKAIDRNIYGISFQRQTLVPGYWSMRSVSVDNDEQPYLYQLVGTWGQIVFPEHWREFRQYYDARIPFKHLKPKLEGMITDTWYQQKGERIWTPWFIRFVYAKNYYCLYTNFPDRKALSASHRDSGENYKFISWGTDATVMIYKKDTEMIKKYMEKPLVDASKLIKFDYCFREVPKGTVVPLSNLITSTGSSSSTHFIKSNMNYVLVFTEFDHSQRFWKNQLCYIEQHASRKLEGRLRSSVIFVARDAQIAHELFYRGYQVIHIDGSPSSEHNEATAIQHISKNMGADRYLFITTSENKLIYQNPFSSNGRTTSNQRGSDWIIVSATTAQTAVSNQSKNLRDRYDTFEQVLDIFTNQGQIPFTGSKKFDSSVMRTIKSDQEWPSLSLIRDDDLACTKISCWR